MFNSTGYFGVLPARIRESSDKLPCREYESDLRSNEHYLGSSEKKAWKKKKNSGLYGIWIHDLCDTGTVLYQLS